MATKVTFIGGKELERALLELSDRTAKKISRAALRKVAKPILDTAKAHVPVREGRLRRSLRIKVDQVYTKATGRQPVIEAEIGPGGAIAKQYRPATTSRAKYSYQIGSRPDVYGKFVEFGTSDTRPQPFMRPAWDSQGGQTALNRLGKELGDAIEREAAGLRRR